MSGVGALVGRRAGGGPASDGGPGREGRLLPRLAPHPFDPGEGQARPDPRAEEAPDERGGARRLGARGSYAGPRRDRALLLLGSGRAAGACGGGAIGRARVADLPIRAPPAPVRAAHARRPTRPRPAPDAGPRQCPPAPARLLPPPGASTRRDPPARRHPLARRPAARLARPRPLQTRRQALASHARGGRRRAGDGTERRPPAFQWARSRSSSSRCWYACSRRRTTRRRSSPNTSSTLGPLLPRPPCHGGQHVAGRVGTSSRPGGD